jgi:Tol biopolymer transport system component
MKSGILRFLVPGAAVLLFAGALAPLTGAAQADPATPAAGAAVTDTVTSTAAITATAAVTPAAGTTVTTTLKQISTVTETGTITAPASPKAGSSTATVKTSAGVKLRVRSGPGSNYPIVARLANGQTVNVLARDASGKWLQVEFAAPGGDFGWISTNYAATNTPVAQLPVSNAISKAAPVSTAAAATGTVSGTAAAGAVMPAPGPLPGKIAVPVFDTERQIYNIWLVDANGSNLRRVVENASSPALSADGTLLAYRHWQRDDRGIVVANSDGANPLRLTDKLEDVLPSFSPDKTKIVFSTYRQGDRLDRIYYVWTDEQNQRAWEWGAGGLFGKDPDWMADGQIAFYASSATGETDLLRLMNGDATNQRTIFSTPSIGSIAGAPDSSAIAYMSAADGNWDIYSVDVQGGSARRLTNDPARDGLPAWSPDGNSIAFVSDRSGQWALWVMNKDGSNERMLALLPGPVDGRVQFEPDYLNNGWLEEQIAWSW